MSSRSVSRWENGNTMLDISILVELADYYDVDIRELLNGERKNENMNEDMKETLTMVADYAEKQKKQAIIIAFQCVSNLMIVFGLLPMTGSFLPMISHGTSRNWTDSLDIQV